MGFTYRIRVGNDHDLLADQPFLISLLSECIIIIMMMGECIMMMMMGECIMMMGDGSVVSSIW